MISKEVPTISFPLGVKDDREVGVIILPSRYLGRLKPSSPDQLSRVSGPQNPETDNADSSMLIRL